jgi:hypothetical protein
MLFDNDIYQFKITYLTDLKKQPYRIIEVEKHQTLTQFAEAILNSFNWGCIHCFGFYDNLRKWNLFNKLFY